MTEPLNSRGPQPAGQASRGPEDKPSGEPTTRSKALGFVATALIIVVTMGCGSLLLDIPPTLPKDIKSSIVWLAGLLMTVTAGIVATFFNNIRYWIAKHLPALKRNRELLRPRRIAVLVGVLAVVALVAWLVPKPVAAALEPGDLILLSAIDESPSDPRNILIDQWNQSHPNNQVRVIDAPGEPDQQHDRMVNDAKAGGRHEADIYLLDNVWMAEFIQDGYIQPLDESLRTSQDSDYFQNVLETCRDIYGRKAGLWALPLNTDAGLMFYRSDLVEEPLSWDDYFGTAAKAAMAEIRRPEFAQAVDPLQFANAAQLANEEVLTVTAFEAMWAAGGEVVNSDGRPILNEDDTAVEFDEQAREGLRSLAAAFADRDITAADAGNTDEAKAAAQFKEGQALYMRNWPVWYDRLRSTIDRPPVPFEVARLPGPSVLGGQNLAISASTERPRAAQAFMEFLTSPSSQLILFEVGGFAPTRPTVYRDASNVTRTYADALRSSIEDARPRPVTPNYIEFSKEFRLGVTRALRNGGEFESDFPNRLAAIYNER